MSFEEAVSSLNELFFFKEFTFSQNIFRTQENKEFEFADNVIWLQDLLIVYQVKERSLCSYDPAKERNWFNSKVLRNATRQIRNTLNYLNQYDKIPLKNRREQTFELSKKSLNAIDRIILYYSNEFLPIDCKDWKFHRSREAGLIHIFPIQDYLKICQTLITPPKVHEYLQFRENLINDFQRKVCKVTELALLGQFLLGDLDQEPNEKFLKFLYSLEQDHGHWNMSSFLEDFSKKIIESVQSSQYIQIISEIAKLNRNDLIAFKDRFKLTLEKAKSNEISPPYRMVIPRTGCGFVFIPCPIQFRDNQIQALKNFTHAHKYDQKLSKCLGMSIARDDADYFLIFWAYLEFPWEYNQEMDIKLKHSFPFREIKPSESPRYTFNESA